MPNMLTREKSDYGRKVQEKAVMEKRQMAIERVMAEGARPAAAAPPAPAPAPRQARVLTLEHAEHHDSTLYRLEKGCYLQFCPGPSLLGRKVFLYTNYVVNYGDETSGSEAEFVRNQYYGLEWRREAEAEADADAGAGAGAGAGGPLGAGVLVADTDMYCELKLQRAGSFHYYFVYDTPESSIGPQGSGWFHVAPTLRAGGAELPLDAVACQTVLAKCLGPLARWEPVLRAAHEARYNMIHFTPVQELGGSRSGYSIANQLRLDPSFGADATFADVENLVAKMRHDWQMLSICDIVLNHTANETPWLAEHPEATYNCRDCPYLRPAALLDAALARFSRAVARQHYQPRLPATLHNQHMHVVRELLEAQVAELRLHEMYACDAAQLLQDFYYMARNKVPAVERAADEPGGAGAAACEELRLVADPQRRRLRATVDLDLALRLYNVYRADCYDEESRLKKCCDELKQKLEQLNAAAADAMRDHLRAAVDNCLAGITYERLQEDGPKYGEVNEKHPLVPRYFTWVGAEPEEGRDVRGAEAALWGAAGARCAAHNGWVMAADPLQDFAAQDQDARVYLRRELIAWGDSVKLRYGSRPDDSPFLWAHMREYVELTAEVFDGVRLDNCHSTPLHVAEYLLDCARNVKPDLYVVAELFTNSDHVDNIFVNRLGITSLIREAQSAWDAHEQGRQVHRFGGRPVGAFLQPPRRAAAPHVAHALFMDLTHDNPAPAHTRTVFDYLPTAAMVAMACCASGSTRGYDDLVPHHIHVVEEERVYTAWGEGGGVLTEARRALNELHARLAREGYSQLYVDDLDAHTVAVTRHHPATRESVILVASTCFRADAAAPRHLRPLRVEGQLHEILFEMDLRHQDHKNGGDPLQTATSFARNPNVINGLTEYAASVRRGVPLAQSAAFAGARRDGSVTELEFRPLLPGTVVAIKVGPAPAQAVTLAALQALIERADGGAPDALGLRAALADLDLLDLNTLLYCSEPEERERAGGGVYDVPGHGPLPYAGLQGVAALLAALRPADDLGHALCANLRAGDWLLDYTWRRLDGAPRLAGAAGRLRELLRPLADLPRYLVPAYADALLRHAWAAARGAALARLGGAARGCSFARALALTSVQLTAELPSAVLPAPSPALAPRPRPATLSAGLPHFAVGYMRCWGRDTFVSLRGLYLLTGRFQEARAHIVGFAACVRHGLVPNLLDGGRNARYNCRDAVWWWLYAIQQYCTEVPNGHMLLSEPVSRLFPRDDAAPAPPGAADQPLHDVMQETLDVHFQGLVFRERNAGRQIDAHMSDKGFNVQIGIDPETGFPFGGNDANCGTWMDKMGSSEAAGTRGTPASPRDGSAVELVALAHAAAAWLRAQHAAGRYPHAGLVRRHRDGSLTSWAWAAWADRLRAHFERAFWVPAAPGAADARPDLVHRRAIYKDTHGATRAYADYQLRCNYAVAMAVAPALFDPRHAWLALDSVERLLLGPLGVKTLDPADWAYRGDYDNSNDGTDPAVAHGFNYHQGPEWVWPLGFYVRARLAFAHENGCLARTVAAGYAALGPLLAEIRTSPWRGLPELTNAGGAFCRDSCRTQAWSSASALEALHALREARRARPLGD